MWWNCVIISDVKLLNNSRAFAQYFQAVLWKIIRKEDKDLKYEEFVGYVQTKIEEKLGEEVRVELHQVIKNNSVELDGLSFYGKDNHMAPTIYLNDLYAEYEDGKTMPEIVDKIVSLYQNAVTTENFRA